MSYILLLFIGILAFLVLGFIYQSKASQRDEEIFPAPGVLTKTSCGDLHLHCQGQGDVTVILEAGQGDSSLDWRDVQSGVAVFTRVCAYDRPGLGWSSPTKSVLTAQQIANNLYQALKRGNRGALYACWAFHRRGICPGIYKAVSIGGHGTCVGRFCS
jgi:hypothetical protein